MRLGKDSSQITSYMGSCISLALVFILALYAYQKADVLVGRKDVDVLSTVNDLAFTPDDIFDYSKGFNLAVAFTAYDSNPEPILDPTIGELVFNHYEWGP